MKIITASNYYQNYFDKDWTKQGRRFFVFFDVNDNMENIVYIHDVQNEKFYWNYENDNDRFHNVYETLPNFNLTGKHNRERISRLLKEKKYYLI
jgi:hypothetical protein